MRIVTVVVMAGLAMSTSGCTSPVRQLMEVEDVAALAPLAERYERLPHRTAVYDTDRNGATLKVAIHESGDFDASRVIVLMHGAFSDADAWRFVAGDLGSDFHLVMPDLPGCGESDAPDAHGLGDGAYGPDDLAIRSTQALSAHLRNDDRPITLVAHSVGGTVALRMLGNQDLRSQHDELLGRVDHAILLAPADVENPNPPQRFVKIASMSGFMIDLGHVLGMLHGIVEEGTALSVGPDSAPLRSEADKRLEIMLDDDRREAMQAMLRELVPLRESGFDFIAIAPVVADYKHVHTPIVMLWGARDDTLPVAMGYKLATQLPRARLRVVPGCKHSLHFERPALVSEVIRSEIDGNGNRIARDASR